MFPLNYEIKVDFRDAKWFIYILMPLYPSISIPYTERSQNEFPAGEKFAYKIIDRQIDVAWNFWADSVRQNISDNNFVQNFNIYF